MGPEDPQLAPPKPPPTPAPFSGMPRSTERPAYRGRTLDPGPFEIGPPLLDEKGAPIAKPDIGEMLGASLDNLFLNQQSNSAQTALNRAYDNIIARGRAAGVQLPLNPIYAPNVLSEGHDPVSEWHREVGRMLEDNPKLAETLGPITREAINAMADQLSRDAQAKYLDIKERRGEGFWSLDTLAEFGVNLGGSFNDPINVMTMPVGGTSKTVLGAFVKEAAANAAADALIEPIVQSRQMSIGNVKSLEEALQNAGYNILLDGALGGLIGGGGKGAQKGAARLFPNATAANRMQSLVDTLPDWQALAPQSRSAIIHAAGAADMARFKDMLENNDVRPTRTFAAALRDAATTADPANAARLTSAADQIDQHLDQRDNAEQKFQEAKDALKLMSEYNAETDPDAAALYRRTMTEIEKEWATANQIPEGVERDTFVDLIESADRKLLGLQEFMEAPEPRRADPPAGRLDISDDGPTPHIGERLMEDGKPVTFTRFDPRQLGVAPDEFQYKRFNGQEGVNGAIADVEQWHAPSSGKILVYERANGELIVADGHQRRSKALGIMQGQGRDDIRLDGYLYREADGWTPADLRLKGAQKNIREGRSDVLDTAQALRERPDAIDSSFPLSRSNIRQARQIARLSDEAWDLTRAGVLEPSHAALIGQVADGRPEIHGPLARTLIEAAPENQRQAESILSEALLDYAERDHASQPSLFGDDTLGRSVMYRERAQIMDAAYAWLRSERSVFKALVDKGDIARALGNELVDAANLTAKDQVELAIAAIMHARRAGVRTAVSDMISRALDSVRREGVTPARAGQQVARDIRALVDEHGFAALMKAEGPAPPQMSEAGPLFDGPGSPAHIDHADMLEGELRPEGIEDPGVKLADAVKQPDPVETLVAELKNARTGKKPKSVMDQTDAFSARRKDQATIDKEAAQVRDVSTILDDIRKQLEPQKAGADAKPVDPIKEAEAELEKLQKAEAQLRDMLLPLTDAQKVSLMKMQYPDAYPWLNRLEGAELDDAIVGRVMMGEVKFARRPEDLSGLDRLHNGLPMTSEDARDFRAALWQHRTMSADDLRQVLNLKPSTPDPIIKIIAEQTYTEARAVFMAESTARAAEVRRQIAQEIAVLRERGVPEPLIARLMGLEDDAVDRFAEPPSGEKKSIRPQAATSIIGGLTTDNLTGRIRSDFGDGANALLRLGEINIAQTPPKGVAPDTQGVTDAQGRVTIFASNVKPDEVRGLILHEVGVHAGLDGVLGPVDKAQLLDHIRTRMMAAAPDHALWRAMGIHRQVPAPPSFRFEPMAKMAADDLTGLPMEDWAGAIKAERYPVYRLPPDAEDVELPGDYVVVREGEDQYAVRQDHLRQREAAGARVTLLSDDKAIVAAMNRVPLDTRPQHIAEETLAYMVQHAPKSGIVKRLIADIRAWLYKTFPKLREWMTLTDADLQSLAIGAVRQRIREANRPVSYALAKGGAVTSTIGPRYARRPRDGSGSEKESGGGVVRPGDGGPAGAGGDAGAGGRPDLSGAAGSGAGESGVQLQRVTPTDAVPEPPKIVNGKVVLTDAERAARKQAWKSFVDNAVVNHENHVFRTDWRFRNGERVVGKVGPVESLHYHFTPDGAFHESWHAHLAPDMTFLKAEIHGKEGTIHDTSSSDELRSTGLGQKLYMAAIDDMLARGVIANSDVEMSQAAIDLWRGLAKYGYEVVQRAEKLEPLPRNRFTAPVNEATDGQPALFFVARKKPPAPDLPMSERDVTNQINEARDLNEHIPSCIKGK